MSNQIIKLKLLEKQDLQKIIDWNVDKSADDLMQWAGPKFNYPLILKQLENYFLSEVLIEKVFVYKILLASTDEMIGTIEIREIDETNKIGKICRFLIGEKNNRGNHIGTAALNEILKIGFKDMNFKKITLGVFDFNYSAIRCYEKVGFVKESLSKNIRKVSNAYWNLYKMSILKPES
ncbi:GNAT family N-acetyltransferase [Clostridium felsineum]|uniref:GNAT family N-acetyltransferase n=1 Tax=Clostridium felsineum TaxID=36839 RepID=UPI00214D3F8F|nr:GNAT family protein [Clostridium felsineum]